MRCSATSKVHHGQCKRDAIAGGTVCRYHGGAAPQVKKAAQLRLAALVDPAIGVLAHAMRQKGKQLPAALAAAKDVLDRNGMKQPDEVKITGTLTVADVLRQRRAKRSDSDSSI